MLTALFIPCHAQVCKPVSVIDGLLNDMQEDERKFLEVRVEPCKQVEKRRLKKPNI